MGRWNEYKVFNGVAVAAMVGLIFTALGIIFMVLASPAYVMKYAAGIYLLLFTYALVSISASVYAISVKKK